MKRLSIILIIAFNGFIFLETFPQPQNAIHPMTGQGARGITGGNLYWDNPTDISYNEVYLSSDSSLVYSLDPSVKILSGFPVTVFDSASINSIISRGTKYYWRVVLFDSAGNNPGDVWFFKSYGMYYLDESFSNLNDWEILGPSGINNWNISNTSFAGAQPPELKFDNIPAFNGISRIIYKPILASDSYCGISFNYFFDGDSGSTIGCAYTTDDGITWSTLWETSPSENKGNMEIFHMPSETYMQIGFYYEGNTNNLNGWYIDDASMLVPLSGPISPGGLKAKADTSALRVNLSWNAGSSPNPWSYRIERKEGIPISSNNYSILTGVPLSNLSYTDTSIQLNKIYTYRIQLVSGPGMGSNWSNEATAYVPVVVPVELVTFNANVFENDVVLNWATSTEKNNYGFEVQKYKVQSTPPSIARSHGKGKVKNEDWEVIGFIEGEGTTTEKQFYSFIDENVEPGKNFYRLKQIDYDGSFEFSKEIEVEIGIPQELKLFQNYPNPFNPTTKIKFSIPTNPNSLPGGAGGGLVTLKVYDVLGNEVATLVNEQKSPGVYEVEFDASNLSSGVYFYKLTAGNFSSTKKLLLMK